MGLANPQAMVIANKCISNGKRNWNAQEIRIILSECAIYFNSSITKK